MFEFRDAIQLMYDDRPRVGARRRAVWKAMSAEAYCCMRGGLRDDDDGSGGRFAARRADDLGLIGRAGSTSPLFVLPAFCRASRLCRSETFFWTSAMLQLSMSIALSMAAASWRILWHSDVMSLRLGRAEESLVLHPYVLTLSTNQGGFVLKAILKKNQR